MKFRDWLAGVMAGRNGSDRLNLVFNGAAIVLIILSAVMRGPAGRLFWLLGLLCFVLSIFRSFSRNIGKRSMENQRYLQLTSGIRAKISGLCSRLAQRKNYCFFKCPSCKTLLRVPRGKGKINITCRSCGERFEKRT